MCGIAGYYVSERSDFPDLDKMISAIRHRGPDGHGTLKNGRIGLGHTRLSILDLRDVASQPMTSRSGNSTISFNGEIYNFRELMSQDSLRTNGDTEVLLELMEQRGMPGLDELNGMFSFAFWSRQEDTLHLVRDRIGIKPLYYYWDGKDLLFASEIKSILKGLQHTPEIDHQALQDFLHLKYIPAPATIFKNIYKLEPGHFLRFDGKELTKKRYYDLCAVTTKNPSTEIEKDFTELLNNSVQSRLISDVPVGAFLSGGVDSSLVCSFLDKSISQTFTVEFEENTHNEAPYAKRVAEELGLPHHIRAFRHEELAGLLDDFVSQYDEPFADGSSLPTLLVSKFAREQVKVSLSGDGGDELFMGYGYYRWYERIARLKRLAGRPGIDIMRSLLGRWGSRARRASRVMDIPKEDWWIHVWSQEQSMFTRQEVEHLTRSEFECSLNKEWSEMDRTDRHPFEKIATFDLLNYLPGDLLHKVDYGSMKYGLEIRTPLLDHRLVEFVLGIPVDYKRTGQDSKILPKKVLEKKLSHDLVHRTKWGFPAPMTTLLTGPFSHLIDQFLSKEKLEEHGLIDHSVVEQFTNEFRNGTYYHNERIWSLLVFQMWFERYMN